MAMSAWDMVAQLSIVCLQFQQGLVNDLGSRKWARKVLRNDLCTWCHGPGGTIEHVVPRSHGGGRRAYVEQCVGACGKCNHSRGNLDILRWWAQIQGKPILK